MPRYYVHNLETDKLNIFTGGKADWLTIPEADRDRIKGACLWSRSINGWVSRCKGGIGRFYAEDILKRNGFEDRGAEGERLTFAEQVEAKQDRASDRAGRFEDRTERAESASDAAHKRSHDMMDAISFGQPILVGHYSEGRDRRYRERAWNLLGKAVAESDKAKHYAERAATARATAEGAEYSSPRYLGNRIKETLAEIAIIENRLQGKFYAHSEPRTEPISEEYRERLTAAMERQQDKLAFHQHCLATCGRPLFDKAALAGMTQVKIRGRWEPIVKLNPKTVATPNTCFPLPEHQRKWALKYAYSEVQEAR